MNSLDTLLLTRVLGYLEPDEILRCSCVNTEMAAAADYEECWKDHCIRLWRGKARMPFSYDGAKEDPFPLIRISDKCLLSLSLKTMKSILRARCIHFSSFLEKSDFKKAIVESTPLQVQRWAVVYNSVWKSSYFYSLADSSRQILTRKELIDCSWNLFFKRGGPQSWDYRFLPDQTTKTNISMVQGENRISRWKFIGDNPPCVQVDSYPKLVPRRRDIDWGWELENDHVIMYSENYGIDVRQLFESSGN